MQERKRRGQGTRKERVILRAKRPRPQRRPVQMNVSYGRFGQEIKTMDSTFNAALTRPYVVDILAKTNINIDTTGVLQGVNLVQQGTGVSQRVGNKISMKSLRLRLTAVNTTEALDTMSCARFMVIYDQQPDGNYPAIGTIIQSINESGTITNGTIHTNLSVNQLERYTVLMDETRVMPPQTPNGLNGTFLTNSTEERVLHIDKFINLNNLEVVFSATSAPMLIANVQRGALYILSLGDLGQGAEPFFWKGELRLRYHDN